MSQYKLVYYDLTGYGEVIRYIFAIAGVEYEDERIPINPTNHPVLPKSIKDATPWGSLPVLEIDGKVKLAQSNAICRFLAKKYNLAGADDIESAKIDEIVDAMNDFANEFRASWIEKDEAKKLERSKKLQEITIPFYMGKFDKIAKENGKWLVGSNGLSWGDLLIAHFLTFIGNRTKIPLTDKYPAIQKLMDDVYSNEKIKEWIAKRPEGE